MFDAKTFLKSLTTRPGVYQMLSDDQTVLYVGKARNLRARVSSYFKKNLDSVKTVALMRQVNDVNVIITHSENEALLLENTLIKKLSPKYNILFRDDKSYPYLFLSNKDEFPRMDLHRGPHKAKGEYFGPFPSVAAVRESFNFLQKVFKIRQCRNSFFRNRTRPCLQYQMKRCSGPCVGMISEADYRTHVERARLFLQGKSQKILSDLTQKMQEASTDKEYEQAATYRDQMIYLRQMQEQQSVYKLKGDVDVLAVSLKSHRACVQVLFVREGRVLGNQVYYPSVPKLAEAEDVLNAFLTQYYLNGGEAKPIPRRLLINVAIPDKEWLQDALSEFANHKVLIGHQVRGVRAQWLKLASQNAEHALESHLSHSMSYINRLESLQQCVSLASLPQRLECFDVSHTQGEATVASCIVFDTEGPKKSAYRRFNITDITKGDDYAALRQALMRRFKRVKDSEENYPDVVLIDGGKGQLAQAEHVLEELQISGICLLAISKGPGRKPEFDQVWQSAHKEVLDLSEQASVLHLLQTLRDEAHRFAITTHRKQRSTRGTGSVLDEIEGVGAKRRRELLRYFGGLQEIKRASIDELNKAPGISRVFAQRIYQALHGE